MSLSSNNNKETFKLLDVSSDSDSDVLQLEIAPRKRRLNRSRRLRNKTAIPHTWSERWGPRAAVLAASAALLAWLAALSWAAAALAADTHRLDAALREVSMGSQSVGDALQRCHSAAKELLHNHTEMAARLDQLVLRTDNLTAQVKVLHSGLSEVQHQLASAPELVSIPQQLADLQASVARFGSQLKDMDSTVASLKAQQSQQEEMKRNVTQLESSMSDLWNRTMALEQRKNSDSGSVDLQLVLKQQEETRAALALVAANVSQSNSTLTSMINWATQDYKADHHKVEGLLESVQNNSAALSSLQTAWRQGNAILARNISDLSQQVTEKSGEFQRQLRLLQEKKAAPSPPNFPYLVGEAVPPASSPAPSAAPQQGPQALPLFDVPKIIATESTQLPGITKAPIPVMRRAATGKPNILTGGA